MAMIRVAFLPHIGEWREIRDCPECGEPTFCLDPGDGLADHLGDDIAVETIDEADTTHPSY